MAQLKPQFAVADQKGWPSIEDTVGGVSAWRQALTVVNEDQDPPSRHPNGLSKDLLVPQYLVIES